MKIIENFQWNDIVLFSKGWYESTDDLFYDVEQSIRKNNNYQYFEKRMSEERVIMWLFKALDEVYEHLTEKDKKNNFWLVSHSSFYDKVNNKQILFVVSLNKAIVLTILEIFLQMDNKMIKLNKPVYKKGERRLGTSFGHKYPISMTYKHMNDIATKIFDKCHINQNKNIC